MIHSLATAAAACGINKSTVLRAIKAGKISATRNEHQEWQIDAAELHRVYPPVAAAAEGTDALRRHAPTADAMALALAHQRTAAAERQLSELKAMLEDMRTQRDSWQRMAEAKLLPAPAQEPKPMTWWQWLRTTG